MDLNGYVYGRDALFILKETIEGLYPYNPKNVYTFVDDDFDLVARDICVVISTSLLGDDVAYKHLVHRDDLLDEDRMDIVRAEMALGVFNFFRHYRIDPPDNVVLGEN